MTSHAERKFSAALLALAALLPVATAQAQPAARAATVSREDLVRLPKPADLKPTGPVTLTSDKAELVQGNSAVYTGNVVLSSTTRLKLEGDRVELKQYAGGQYEAKITGGPAKMNHVGNGPENPPVSAHARTLNYDSRSGVLDLISEAFVMRATTRSPATPSSTTSTSGASRPPAAAGGQVKIILQPNKDPAAASRAISPGATP